MIDDDFKAVRLFVVVVVVVTADTLVIDPIIIVVIIIITSPSRHACAPVAMCRRCASMNE
jgi:phage shock protein PspC (stress-responsive transcriptional regulator)